MTMEPPTSCSAMNFRPKAVSEIFYGARGRDPSTSETNGHDPHGGLLRNERMHESAPKDITSYCILLHIISSLLYESESNCYVDNHRICRKKETLPTHRTLLSPQNRCSGISKHCGGVQFQAARAQLQLDFSGREPWKWHSNPPIEK